MSLFPSIITSFAIVGAIWVLTIFQPSIASESDNNQVMVKQDIQRLPAKRTKQPQEHNHNMPTSFNFGNIEISGVSQIISLSEVTNLWQDFNNNKTIQSNLKKNPSKVYAYYRNFSPDYKSATISVGYDSQELKAPTNNIDMSANDFRVLLSKGKYDDIQIQQAWEKLDYRKFIIAVVEVHYLNNDSVVTSSEIFVSYK